MSLLFEGRVTSVNVKGHDPNSAQLLFTVQAGKSAGSKHAFVVLASPTHEPQAFAGMAAFVTAAYFANASIAVRYVEAKPTDLAVEVFAPSASTGSVAGES